MRRVAGTAAAVVLLCVLARSASAQTGRHDAVAGITGRYEQPGCVLEVAPVATDSVRVQLRCRLPSPTYNLGIIDERLPLRGRDLTHETHEVNGSCRIGIRFSEGRALVTQHGTDYGCGLGGGIDVSGSYRRTSRRRPAFDLEPC